MRTHETNPDDTGHVNILSKAEWLRLYSRPKRLSVRGARRDSAPQQRDHAYQQRDSAPQQRSNQQPPCLRERKASSSSSDPRLKRSVRWADDEEESGERARRGDREEARYHPDEEANEEKEHAQLRQQGAYQAEGAKLQGANEKEERQRRNAEEEDEEGLDEEQMEALATARASLHAKHLQEAMEEERRGFDLEEAAREANTFGPNEGQRRLYSALLLTEVMKEREAQLDMKRRIRERQHAEQRQEEEQRRCFVAAQEERVRLWRDREAEKFRESQAARDRVFHKLAALQLDKESRERRREEEQVSKYLAEQEAKQAQIMREEAEAKEQLYRSFASDRADRLAPEMPER